MKKILMATAALAALTTAAFATDLPNKKKAPAAAPAVAAASSSSADSLSISYGQDLGNNFGAKVDDAYGVAYTHKIDAFSIGAAISTSQDTSNTIKQNVEGQVGYSVPVGAGVSVTGKVGIGSYRCCITRCILIEGWNIARLYSRKGCISSIASQILSC